MVVHIDSAKMPQHEGSISSSSFYGKLPDYQSHVFSLIYPVDEFSLKEMKAGDQSKISSYCFCVWCESRELEGRGSSRFPCITPVVETFSSYRVAFRVPLSVSAPLRKQSRALACRLLPQKSPTTDFRPNSKCGSCQIYYECGMWEAIQ